MTTATVAATTHPVIAEQAEQFLKSGHRMKAIDLLRPIATTGEDAALAVRLASMLESVGEDEEAISLLERVCRMPTPPMNALVNLAIMYEDAGDYLRAERCLRKVLETEPAHERARLFLKDVLASRDCLYDEDQARDDAKRNQMLDQPVTDFELSVRARNCLKKMQIRTLGDLLKITESELLAYKNFGETSLIEIKQMLAAKGLRLGQGLEGAGYARVRNEIYEKLKEQVGAEVLEKSVASLEFSVRCRKALQMLGVQTLGDLASRTEAELMGVKNFGQTSLDEIRERLADHGLGLRTLEG